MTVKVQAELTAKDNLSPKLDGLERSLEKFRVGVETNSKGIRKLENSFENVAIQATRLDGNLGMLADALIEFAPGGFVGLAAIAGIAALIKYFQDLDTAQKEATVSAKDLSYSILEAVRGADAVANQKYIDSLDEVAKAEQALRNLRADAAQADQLALARAQGRVGAMAQPISTIDRKREAELIKARNDALNATVQLGNRVSEINRRNEEKAAREREIASKDAKTQLEKDLKEREDLIRYSNEQRIKFEENLQKTIQSIIEANYEQARVNEQNRLRQREELQKTFNIPTADQFGEQLRAQFEVGRPEAKAFEEMLKNTILLTNSLPMTFSDAFKNATLPIVEMAAKAQDLNSVLGNLAGSTLVALQDGFANAFEAIGQGGNAFGELGKAAKNAVAQAAGAEGRLAFGRGLAELAKAISNPVTAPKSLAAAGKFFAAGAFLSTLAGTLGGSGGRGGAGGAGGGGIGGAGGLNNSSLGQTGAGQGTVTINITGGGILDMTNADTQRSFVRALESVTNKRAVILGV